MGQIIWSSPLSPTMGASKIFKDIVIKMLTGGAKPDYATLASQLTLTEAIAKIDWLFGCESILKETESDFTVPYYTQSEWGYQLYHSGDDAIHMALNPDGVFDPDGYYAQPRVVANKIDELEAKTVLELGCGKGFNSRFLAQQYPQGQFTGIDLTPAHIQIAQQKVQNLTNLSFQTGDFTALDFPDQSFDLVFAFECLCHAAEPAKPLLEIQRVLRPGGQLIVFDGYRQIQLAQLPPALQTATQLVEVSMAVRHGFAEIDDWRDIAQSLGLRVQVMADLTVEIQPTLAKLQRLALKLLSLSWKGKILTALLPKYLVRNAIAALLMPFTFSPQQEALRYYKLILEKPRTAEITANNPLSAHPSQG